MEAGSLQYNLRTRGFILGYLEVPRIQCSGMGGSVDILFRNPEVDHSSMSTGRGPMSGLRRLASADPFRMSSSPYWEASLLQNCYGTRGPEDYGEYHPGAQSLLDKFRKVRALGLLPWKLVESCTRLLLKEFLVSRNLSRGVALETWGGTLAAEDPEHGIQNLNAGTWNPEPSRPDVELAIFSGFFKVGQAAICLAFRQDAVTKKERWFHGCLLVVAWYACSVPTMTPMPLEFVEVVKLPERRCVLLENLASDPIDVDDDRPCWVRKLLRLDEPKTAGICLRLGPRTSRNQGLQGSDLRIGPRTSRNQRLQRRHPGTDPGVGTINCRPRRPYDLHYRQVVPAQQPTFLTATKALTTYTSPYPYGTTLRAGSPGLSTTEAGQSTTTTSLLLPIIP
ncbi:hypothetical protein F2Q68_00043866 [Brassica cretica]|uniref:Uncharacterized protein n=1 Tax=Brassica cretica TaxID=69181 RepID=A0A8S9LQQ4_BRACR|nr:hypothetical protein F2Q68_00043866 [Brassica cretica]